MDLLCVQLSLCVYMLLVFFFSFTHFCLFPTSLFFFKFACLFSKEREREKEGMRLNEWIEFGRRWVRRNCDQNIKKLNNKKRSS